MTEKLTPVHPALTPVQQVIEEGRQAIAFLRRREPEGGLPPGIQIHYMGLDAMLTELQAAASRVATLEGRASEMERSHSLSLAARDSDHRDASNEITRLRKQNAKQAERLKQIISDIPENQYGEVLLKAREAIDWIRGLGENGAEQSLHRSNFVTCADVLGQLEVMARVLVTHQPEAIGLNELRAEVVNSDLPYDATKALVLALKIIDRDQRARLAKENGRD
jgi:hypothetical protein